MKNSNFAVDPVLEPVTNDDLICKDCVYRLTGHSVMRCEKYDTKPESVISEDTCPEYE